MTRAAPFGIDHVMNIRCQSSPTMHGQQRVQVRQCRFRALILIDTIRGEPVGCEFPLRSTIALEIRGLRSRTSAVRCHACATSRASSSI
jgi:hypothetical protein